MYIAVHKNTFVKGSTLQSLHSIPIPNYSIHLIDLSIYITIPSHMTSVPVKLQPQDLPFPSLRLGMIVIVKHRFHPAVSFFIFPYTKTSLE